MHLRLCLRLLTCTALIENEVRTRLQARFGQTLAQFDLMSQLYRRPEGLTMSELSQRLMVTNGNITGLVDRLIQRELVRRRPSTSDRRILFVLLTPHGKKIFGAMAQEHEQWVRELLGLISPTDVTQLMQLLAETKRSIRSVLHLTSIGDGKKKSPEKRRKKNI
jgi:DNA-binding MarR family transcriptional regulator